MIYENIPYGRRFHFLYALTEKGSNHVQFGAGYRSHNGLQVKHIECGRVHLLEVDLWLREVEYEKNFNLGSDIGEHFLIPPALMRDKKGEFLALIERVWKQSIDPRLLRQLVPLDGLEKVSEHSNMLERTGRAVFVKYNKRKDALEIGLQRVTQGVAQLASASGMFDREGALALAAHLYAGRGITFSLPVPMNWGDHTNVIPSDKLPQIAVVLVRMADAIWKA